MPQRILHVAAEIFPLVKTGGLADVVAALPPAQLLRGLDVRVLLPGLPAIRDGVGPLTVLAECGAAFGAGRVTLCAGRMPASGLPVLIIDAPFLYDRPGNPYVDDHGLGWSDNHRRFALLGWIAAQIAAGGLLRDWQPDVLHCHDWHAGLAAAYLAARPGRHAATVFTIHNLAYQGLFDPALFGELGLPPAQFGLDGIEFHGQLSFIKAGLAYSDRITTVSPGYAREILEPPAACGLEGLMRRRVGVLSGILNGVDYTLWNPAADPHIAQPYTHALSTGKQACRKALRSELGLLPRPAQPLFCVVSRLSEQKGLDLVLQALDALRAMGAQLVVLGSGERRLEDAFRAAAQRHAGEVAVRIGYDEDLAHRVIAGADVILVPSRFEPCGLTQLYGLRYGTLPLVRRVGGLADTVVDADAQHLADGSATGFSFDAATPESLATAARRAIDVWHAPQHWAALSERAMACRFSWDAAAERYQALYSELRP